MPILGAHVLLYTTEPQRLRAVLRDVFGWRHVEDQGSEPGWPIFALPAAELGVHPSSGSTRHELSLMRDDIEATKADLEPRGVEFRGEPEDMGFGIGVTMALRAAWSCSSTNHATKSPLDI